MQISVFGYGFQTVQNLAMIKDVKFAQEGPMLTGIDFYSSGVICASMVAQCAKRCLHVPIFLNSFK